MKYLVLWEISKKQEYVFKSNKLKENIGASLIIKDLTENLEKFNIKEENIVFRGGGKSLCMFSNGDDALNFIENFSIKTLKEYTGIEVFFAINDFNEEKYDIINAIEELYSNLESKKSMRKSSAERLSFGIEKICKSTGMPAFCYDDDEREISREINTKKNRCEASQNDEFKEYIPKGYKLTTEIQKLNAKNKEDSKNYMAIIHIDGNGMGKKFNKLKDYVKLRNGQSMKEHNEEYLNALKNFSENVDKVYKNAFKDMCNKIGENKEKLLEVTSIDDGIFPLRPLIIAGDDITYVANGYIGIETARIFIEKLTEQKIEIVKEKEIDLNACAGVAIVKTTYPFIKAYDLAEELCRNAKKIVIKKGQGKDYSAIDWHIEQGEICGSIKDIREKFYSLENSSQDKEPKLTLRPYFINNEELWNYNDFKCYYNRIIELLNNKNIGRNKIKQLREVLIKGKKSTEYFLKFNKMENCFPYIKKGTIGDYCFNTIDEKCMYFDPIEIMDMLIPLE
ncbi:Cas10/Cmr2 second palm domain-containing protein [Hathewaya histolytica]|uniref:Cas10/Cmr2 second palm domain-containing protein n=1 Tax=Hathewaya histolytica TaxID=1498 RepID=UPI003B66EF6F